MVDPQDPFAEWERANVKAAAQKAETPKPVQAPRPVEAPKPAPEQPKPAPKPQAPASEEFSLDDILAEFK